MNAATLKPNSKGRRAVAAALVLTGLALLSYALTDDPVYGGEPGFGRVQAVIAAIGLVISLCAWAPLAAAQRVLLLVLSTLALVALAEIAGERFLSQRHRPIYQFDDRLIFKLIPNRTSSTTLDAANGGATVVHSINSRGFRGPELRHDGKAPRVVVYGDSFIHAYYTRNEQTFCAQLSAALGKMAGRDVEVVNAGVSSYGPDQVALRMEAELPDLKPDLVVVSVFAGNDYGDLLRNKIYQLGATGSLEARAWSLDPKVRRAFDISQRESILKRAARDAMSRWRPPKDARAMQTEPGANVSGTLDFLLEEARREYRSAVIDRDEVVTNTHIDYYSADVSLEPDSASATYKVMLMRAVLQRIQKIAVDHGVRLAFMFVPHRFDAADNYDWGPVDLRRFPRYDPRNQIAPLERMAAQMQVPALSLYDPFRSAGATSLYLKGGEDHWNARGQELAATAMARMLIDLDWVTRSAGAQPTSAAGAR